MKRLLAGSALISLCAASPAWAQANGGANPCTMNVEADAHALIAGAGANLPIRDDDCWKLQRSQFMGLMSVNSHDPEAQRAWGEAARAEICSIDSVKYTATALCGAPPAPLTRTNPASVAKADPPRTPAYVAPAVADKPRETPRAPAIVATVTSTGPASWYSGCPAGVPLSECSH